jgi:tRNA (cmo5U34)-methyltransferase
LGAITLSVLHRMRNTHCRIIAVDNSKAMVERCKQNIPQDFGNTSIEVRCTDMLDVEIQQASLVVINLTMQFIEPAQRLNLLRTIYDGLLTGGALILSEKIAFAKPNEQTFQDNMHIAFKKANAYSELEISQKRTALENVLIPDSIETHVDRLHEAGFESVHQWFQCFNFVSFIAIK